MLFWDKMKKTFFAALLIVMTASGLIFVNGSHFIIAQTYTNVSGIISSDTTWTQANSPYMLTGNVLVNNGVTLTIEAGATVNCVNGYIEVNGTLRAMGSSANPIDFPYGASINFTQYSNGWNEQTSSGSIIENANGPIHVGINDAFPKISSNSFVVTSIYGGSPIISNNIIIGEVVVYSGTPVISNNNFNASLISIYGGSPIISDNNITGILEPNASYLNGFVYMPVYGIILEGNNTNAYISDNTIANHETAGINVVSGTATIQRNLINNNQYGISILQNANLIIQNNTIANNSRGISDTSPSATSTIIYNNIYKNSFNIYLGSSLTNNANPNNVNATYNWWGTTDTQGINQTVYDFKDDFTLGTVTFVPFLTAPNAEAVPNPNAPIPIPASTQSPSPSSVMASTSPPSSSSSPSASPSQTKANTTSLVPVELIVIVVAIVIVVVAIGAFLLGKLEIKAKICYNRINDSRKIW